VYLTSGSYPVYHDLTICDTANWLDHSRDLLHLINVKRHEMPRPIVGIGHSFGGAQLYVFPSHTT
jgi:predicted alpha/beta hydrolase